MFVLETIVVTTGVVILSSLRFARLHLEREEKQMIDADPHVLRRQALEQMRAEYLKIISTSYHYADRAGAQEKLVRVDAELLKMLDR